jgi:xanthine/uracil permease
MENSLRVQDPDRKKKLIKYLLFGVIVGISIRYVPSNRVNDNEILMIAALASITFGIIDMVSPSIVVK